MRVFRTQAQFFHQPEVDEDDRSHRPEDGAVGADEAQQLGLVDRLGGIDDALAEGAKLAKLDKDDWHPRYFEPQPEFSAAFLNNFVSVRYAQITPMDLFARASWQQEQARAKIFQDVSALMSVRGAQAFCLECGGLVPVRQQASGTNGEMLKLLAAVSK